MPCKIISSHILYLLILASCPAWSTLSAQDSSFFDLLAKEQLVAVTLTADIEEIFNSRKIARAEIPAELKLEGDQSVWPVKLSLRGKFRRMNCEFPPLRVVVKKDTLRARGLGTNNDFKLVTHCLSDPAVSKENVLREYLVYKMYNILTPYSLRVQLLEVTYQDTKSDKPPMTRYGMLIEDFDELAGRLGGIQCDSLGLGVKNVDPAQENMMAVFEYMIGNTDWSHHFLRNMKAVRFDDGARRVLIPYDFDYSGVVNASYARPRREIGQTTVRHRVFMGHPVAPALLKGTVNHFQEKREALFEFVRDFELLDKNSRNDVLNYLREFYGSFELLRQAALAD